jgi:4'-phosphopantetheinyl transferase
MPFIHLDSKLPDVSLGMWKIEEDEMFFLERVKLYENEWSRLAEIVHPQRRLEWLSSRLCMKELLKIANHERVESLSAANGKPYLSNHDHHISLTHSTQYAAAIASARYEVGVDIEYRARARNPRTRFLFMGDDELAYYEAHDSPELFLLIWSAKETLYKLYGQGVAFKHNIALDFSGFSFSSEGSLPATVIKNERAKTYRVHYRLQPDFILTYACHSRVSDSETVPPCA